MKYANYLVCGWVESQNRGKLASYCRKEREGGCAKRGWFFFRNPTFLLRLAKTKVVYEMSINVMTKSLENMPSAEFLSIQHVTSHFFGGNKLSCKMSSVLPYLT